MIDIYAVDLGRIALLLVAIAPIWMLSFPAHRKLKHDQIKINDKIGRIFGSLDGRVNIASFSGQIGLASLVIWDIIFAVFDITEKIALSAVSAMFTILLVRFIIRAGIKVRAFLRKK